MKNITTILLSKDKKKIEQAKKNMQEQYQECVTEKFLYTTSKLGKK